MRIDSNTRLGEVAGAEEPIQASARAASESQGKKALGTDKADLSVDQVSVQLLIAEVNRLPEIRQKRVAELELAIRQQRYHVNPEQTAEALLSEMQERSAA